MSLDAFVTHSRPPPAPIASSSEIHDRSSIFSACIYVCTTATQAEKLRAYVRSVVHLNKPASHEMAAWRVMSLKKGRKGLGEDDFEVSGGWKNDGEDGGGKRILETMQSEGVLDAVVVVSRWYGGTMLGPVRFTHIENCTREVCKKFKTVEEIRECIDTLHSLDSQLANLRSQLATLSAPAPQSPCPSSPSAKTSTEDRRFESSPTGAEPASSQLSNSDNTAIDSESETKKRKRVLEGDRSEERNIRPKVPPNYEKLLLDPSPDIEKARRLLKARQSAVKSVEVILERAKAEKTVEKDA